MDTSDLEIKRTRVGCSSSETTRGLLNFDEKIKRVEMEMCVSKGWCRRDVDVSCSEGMGRIYRPIIVKNGETGGNALHHVRVEHVMVCPETQGQIDPSESLR